jgi:DNA-directed RNA polymerase specialized sigma24 family protein
MGNPEQLYRQYRSELLAFIQQRVGSHALAQDILHDVFVKILSRGDCLRGTGQNKCMALLA